MIKTAESVGYGTLFDPVSSEKQRRNPMRKNQTDLRVVRTRKMIKEAFVELMEEKGFDAVTVKDITTRAGINRGTFYAHYQDKFDLMDKYQEEILTEIAEIAKRNLPNTLSEINASSPTLKPVSTVVSILEYNDQNHRFMKTLLGPKGDLTFQNRLKKFMWNALIKNNPNSVLKEENLLVPGHYLVSYIASAHIGVVQQWLNSGRKESPEEMARILSTITVNGPFFAAGLKKV
jgi:AcrR family transcriptional regulator